MQHNWWLSVLEHLGILTRAEAKHLSENIKTRIHKDNYADTFNEVSGVLKSGDLLKDIKHYADLKADVDLLKDRIAALEAETKKDLQPVTDSAIL